MSRFGVNETLREMLTHDGRLERYLADPAGFLAGRDLTEAEAAGLLTRDFGALYALGVHHYPLFQWARLLGTHEGRADWSPAYFAAVAPHGHPDVMT